MSKELYLYESHLDGWYFKNEYLENTYCETCGDSDRFLGSVELDNAYDLFELISEIIIDDTSIDIKSFLKELKEEYCKFGNQKVFDEAIKKLKEFARELLENVKEVQE